MPCEATPNLMTPGTPGKPSASGDSRTTPARISAANRRRTDRSLWVYDPETEGTGPNYRQASAEMSDSSTGCQGSQRAAGAPTGRRVHKSRAQLTRRGPNSCSDSAL
jgi:hypothetical protein